MRLFACLVFGWIFHTAWDCIIRNQGGNHQEGAGIDEFGVGVVLPRSVEALLQAARGEDPLHCLRGALVGLDGLDCASPN
jgi:hypothetical protein